MIWGWIIPGLLPAFVAMGSPSAAPARTITISNGLARVVVQVTGAGVQETYFGKRGTGWKMLLEGGSALRTEPELKCNDTVVPGGFQEAGRVAPASIRLRMAVPSAVIEKTVTLLPDDPHPAVVVTCRVTGRI
ncbi:hypothetical protein EHM92_08465, partial [bacterium]